MSKTTSAIPDTMGKPAAIAAGATPATKVAKPPSPTIVGGPSSPANAGKPGKEEESSETDLFGLSREIEKLLKGVSNKNALKVLNMVGSLHGIRAISVDRPIGQPAAKTPSAKADKGSKKTKGSGVSQQPKAAYKQSPDWIRWSEARAAAVAALKAAPASDAALKSRLQNELRSSEQELKLLKPQSGN